MKPVIWKCLIVVMIHSLLWASGSYGQSLDGLTDTLKPTVAELRGLPFLHDFEIRVQTPDELQQVLFAELDRVYPGETLHALEQRLLKFGFVVSPVDLRQMFSQLLTQQVAGYYDPIKKRMVLIEGTAQPGPHNPFLLVELFSRLLIQRMGLSPDNILLAHELTHALQDQHYDLQSFPLESLDQEDLASAAKALLEGDATMVMLDYMLEPQALNVTQVPGVGERMHQWTDSSLLRRFGVLSTVPRYILDNLFFSYTYGFDFVLHLKRQGGWAQVNQAYQDPPVSTEQILHPEKYREKRDAPIRVQLPALAESFPGWRELERNTLGEFNISILLDGFLPARYAQRASAGWGGDRFGLYERDEAGHLVLVWQTAWDTRDEAREFFNTYAAMLEKRYTENPDPLALLNDGGQLKQRVWHREQGDVLLRIQGNQVVLLDGVPAELQEDVLCALRVKWPDMCR